jgi:hypothetical protein
VKHAILPQEIKKVTKYRNNFFATQEGNFQGDFTLLSSLFIMCIAISISVWFKFRSSKVSFKLKLRWEGCFFVGWIYNKTKNNGNKTCIILESWINERMKQVRGSAGAGIPARVPNLVMVCWTFSFMTLPGADSLRKEDRLVRFYRVFYSFIIDFRTKRLPIHMANLCQFL